MPEDVSWLFLMTLGTQMANKEQIQKHLNLSSNIKLTPNMPDKKSEDARKIRIMEHIKRSQGQR